MRRITQLAVAALAVLALDAVVARAQFVQVYSAPPAVLVPAPVTVYRAPVVVNYAPAVVAPAPTVTYSYYPPSSTVVYSAPPASTVVYSAPVSSAILAPGYYTTRSYYGYGIFRPRGLNVETTYTPVIVR